MHILQITADCFNHFYRPQRITNQVSVILFTGGGAIPECIVGGISACLAAGLQGGLLLGAVPGGDPPGTATAAGSMHPTGMHSC